MDDNLILGIWRYTIPIPRWLWQRQLRAGAQLDFMTEAHHQIRNFVVTELPRVGKPLSPNFIAQELKLPINQVVSILTDLEKHMTFLFRNLEGSVEWAYPVTAAQTPHSLNFSSGETINAA